MLMSSSVFFGWNVIGGDPRRVMETGRFYAKPIYC